MFTSGRIIFCQMERYKGLDSFSGITLENVISTSSLAKKADLFAENAHIGQTRKDGITPYITHPRRVGRIFVEEWGITDPEKVAVCLLHDTVEDTNVTLDEIRQKFGEKIAFYVDMVSKLEDDLDTVKKVFSGVLLDPFVALFKLADRLDNLRDMATMPTEKRSVKAKETLEKYAPLAESLGMWIVKRELEDLALMYADPVTYLKFKNKIDEDPRTRKDSHFIYDTEVILNNLFKEGGIGADVTHRIDSLIRLKDKSKTRLFKDIDYVVCFRVAVDSEEVLKALGIVWEKMGHLEDISRFDNFYFQPRANGYSSFHVTLKFPEGAAKIAITSKEKERYNNWGIVSVIEKGETNLKLHAPKLVFTPTEVKFLPQAAKGIDFAYLIDEKMGAQAESIIIDGIEKDILTVIPNGATVKINMGKNRIAPERDFVSKVLPNTRQKIEKQLLEEEISEEQKKGKEIVTKIISQRGILNLYDLLELSEYSGSIVEILYRLGCKKSLPRLYQSVGSGLITEEQLIDELNAKGITKERMKLTSIYFEGKDEKGILNNLTHIMEQFEEGGNIRRNYGQSNKGIFQEHLVLENLTKNEEKIIETLLRRDPRVNTLIIV